MEKLFAGNGEVKVESDVIDLETRLSVIQALILLGLEAVADVLQQEVEQLAGVRYARKGSEQSYRLMGKPEGVRVSDGPEAPSRRTPCARRRGRHGGFPFGTPCTPEPQSVGRGSVASCSQGDLLLQLQSLRRIGTRSVRDLSILRLAAVHQSHREEAEAVPGATSRRLRFRSPCSSTERAFPTKRSLIALGVTMDAEDPPGLRRIGDGERTDLPPADPGPHPERPVLRSRPPRCA